MGRIAEAPPAADRLQSPPRLRQDAAARDQIGREQLQLGMGGAGVLDPAESPVEPGKVRPPADGGETDPGDHRLAHARALQLPSESMRLLMS